tara:strand:- start:277 stop:459 length:183 start_codon:yes stop_codon:yes gene_type:complete
VSFSYINYGRLLLCIPLLWEVKYLPRLLFLLAWGCSRTIGLLALALSKTIGEDKNEILLF